jgi:hypothetical protein
MEKKLVQIFKKQKGASNTEKIPQRDSFQEGLALFKVEMDE